MAFMAYVDGTWYRAPGTEVLLQLQFIREGFCYDITTRDAMYRDVESEEEDIRSKSGREMKRALMVCCKSEGVEPCPFTLILRTVECTQYSGEERANGGNRAWRYSSDVCRAMHNHEPPECILRKVVPLTA